MLRSFLLTAARLAFLVALFLLGKGEGAFAASSFEVDSLGEKYHVTADRTLYHSREKVYEAFGHVVVSAQGKRLAADYLWLDDNTKDIKARGNVVFVDRESTVESAELHFNLSTGIGAIFYGRVFNDLYTLKGQLIRRVGDDHYLTTEGEYTTCKDCPESWKLSARSVDLTVEGYAHMSSVFVQIKDVPALYLPYLIVPVKKKRQSGLLFPRMGGNTGHGFVFVQPLFLALGEHQDVTLGFGKYSDRGLRYEVEHRYKSYNGIEGTFNGYFTRDRKDVNEKNRGAIRTEHIWPWHRRFDMRLRYLDVRDRDYVFDFVEDINVLGRPAIESNAVAQAPFDDFFLSVEAKRYRNLMTDDPKGFDGGTVQATPTVHAGVKERKLLGPVYGSLYGRFDRFNRKRGPFYDLNGNNVFDPDFQNATPLIPERLREAHRYLVTPELSMPFRAGPFFSVVPSAAYNELRYSFSMPTNTLPASNPKLEATSTRYFQFRLDTSTTFERVFAYDGEKVSKLKHQLQPFVNFSYIPKVHKDDRHRFQQQLLYADGLFDQYDIVPETNSTNFLRFPQGRSVYYGFNSRLIRKLKTQEEMPRSYPYDLLPARKPKVYPRPLNRKQELANEYDRLWDTFDPHYERYQEIWTLNVAQAFDFLELQNQRKLRGGGDPSRAFSHLLAKSHFALDDKFAHDLEYRYYPRAVVRADNKPEEVFRGQHWVTTNLTWYWKKLENLRRTRKFERSLALNYTYKDHLPTESRTVGGTLVWSLNDFVKQTVSYGFDLYEQTQISWAATTILTHPSDCWGLAFRYDWARHRNPNSGQVGFEVLLNLTGTGFLGQDNNEGIFGGI